MRSPGKAELRAVVLEVNEKRHVPEESSATRKDLLPSWNKEERRDLVEVDAKCGSQVRLEHNKLSYK